MAPTDAYIKDPPHGRQPFAPFFSTFLNFPVHRAHFLDKLLIKHPKRRTPFLLFWFLSWRNHQAPQELCAVVRESYRGQACPSSPSPTRSSGCRQWLQTQKT